LTHHTDNKGNIRLGRHLALGSIGVSTDFEFINPVASKTSNT